MLASTFMDMVLGVDIHFEMVPMPAPVPTPLPNPFVGMVFDPGSLLTGAAMSLVSALLSGKAPLGPVIINCQPATTVGQNAKNSMGVPHILIPPGTAWAPMPKLPKPSFKGPPPPPGPPVAPEGDGVIVFGSPTVTFMGTSASRMGDKVMSCGEPVRLPSSTILAIPKGMPVMVGGPPAISISDAIGALLKSKWVAGYLHDLASNIKSDRIRGLVSKAICFVTGHPVDVATGRVLTDHVDWELPGSFPLKFERSYSSARANRWSPLGHGWAHSLDQAVWPERGRIVHLDAEGREIQFDTFDEPGHVIRPGKTIWDPISRLTLKALGDSRYEVTSIDGVTSEFGPVPGATGERKWWSRLLRRSTRDGRAIELSYDQAGNLAWVKDAAGRQVGFDYDRRGRLVAVKLPHPQQQGWIVHTRYAYDDDDDLVAVTDPLGHTWRFNYKQHLLVQETNRNGLSFYFAYDGHGQDAYCTRTWGDGGIYDHLISYDKVGKVTCVTNSLGQTKTYKMNVVGCVTEVIDAIGGETKYEYDERTLWKVKETNAIGGETVWEHDARGNVISVKQPDETTLTLTYGPANELLEIKDVLGGQWRWQYDGKGRVSSRTDPLAGRTTFRYEGSSLSGTTDAAGQSTSLLRDTDGNIVQARLSTGGEARRRFDRLGRCVEVKGLAGKAQMREYDPLGRVIVVREPNGFVRQFEYDAEGNVVRARDGARDIAFKWSGLRALEAIRQGHQATTFAYDTEGRIIAVRNEEGAAYLFERGPSGQVDEEIDFDGARLQFQRNALGRVNKAFKPNGLVTTYDYDPLGRLVAVKHSTGGGKAFKYRQDGRLVEASNGHSKISLKRDDLGRVVRAQQDEDWIESKYDVAGHRIAIQSSRGHRQSIGRSATGDVISLSTGDGSSDDAAFHATFDRDQYGFEVRRTLPGGVESRWDRDPLGLPTSHGVLVHAQTVEMERYSWDRTRRLDMVVDAFRGPVRFVHDELGSLVEARYASGESVLRLPDSVGRLFKSAARDDRRYGKAGQLIEARGPQGTTHYEYDDSGNLARKTEADGRQWRYKWDADGMLVGIDRPDGRFVELRYDALGRRIWKKVGGKITRWLWDDHVPLHEWNESVNEGAAAPPDAAALATPELRPASTPKNAQGPPVRVASGSESQAITWIFEPESFAPLAKLVGGAAYSVITDHRGVPSSMYDGAGDRVWSAKVDVYGDVREVEGDRGFCPFRWPGQYEDADTGLSLNRFRHYDVEMGSFISKDPLRIMGGTRPYAHVRDPLSMVDAFGLNPSDLALGLSSKKVSVDTPNGPITGTQQGVLQDFAKDPVGDGSIKATTWTGLDEVVDSNGLTDFEKTITNGMEDAERIHFNVEGMNGWKDIVANPDPSAFKPPSTNWELATVMGDAELKQKTQLYDGPGNPISCH